MTYFDRAWYCNAGNQSTTGYYAVAQWAATAVIAAGALRRQLAAPSVGNERVFVCIVAGTTGGTEPVWVLTRGAKSPVDGTVTWQECTGNSAVNGDLPNTPTWAAVWAISTTVSIGTVIQRNNGASYWICSTAGTISSSEPAWPNNTAGTTQVDGSVTWTCLGVVGNFTGGQAPHARIANASVANWWLAGNTLYVGDNHAESQTTAITITPVLSATIVSRILCHNHSGSYPPAAGDLTTGATVSTTAAANLTFGPSAGSIYVYGLRLQAGVGSSSTANIILTPSNAFYSFDNCVFQIATTIVAVMTIQVNAANAGIVLWNNCQVSFGNTPHYIDVGTTTFIWQNTGQILASGSVVPTSLMGQSASGRLVNVLLEGLDLSQLTGNLINFPIAYEMGQWIVKDCKLNAAMGIASAAIQGIGQTVQFIRSDSSGTGYKSSRYTYDGTETTETSITRVGGASDPAGQAQSRKIVTSANPQWLRPFQAEPYAIWNATTGANVTVTVYGTINATVLPNNDDIWLEVEYLSSATFPTGSIVNTTKASVLAANAPVASDVSTWNNVPSYASFDDAISGTGTLSNGNLTFTWATLTSGVGSLSGFSTGKYYCEFKPAAVTSAAGDCVGFKVLSTPISNFGISSTGLVVATVIGGGGNIIIDAVTQTNIGPIASNDVICGAVDLANHLVWFRRNGGNWNNSGTANPATSVGGISFTAGTYCPAVVFVNGGSSKTVTADFGATAYAFTPPAGFGNWPISWTPFKLTKTLSAPQPGLAGYIEARIRVAKPSTTYYIDPKPDVTGATVSKTALLTPGLHISELQSGSGGGGFVF